MRININVQNECKFDTGKMKSRVSEALKYGAEAHKNEEIFNSWIRLIWCSICA